MTKKGKDLRKDEELLRVFQKETNKMATRRTLKAVKAKIYFDRQILTF